MPRLSILSILLSILFFSCNKENPQITRAHALMELHWDEGNKILDSINVSELDEENKMKYEVLKFQYKFKTFKDVSNDTVIFEAQKYFEAKKNYHWSTLANFYAGSYLFEKKEKEGIYDKIDGLEFYYKGVEAARKDKNEYMTAKNLHSIGTIYAYFPAHLDTAITIFKEVEDHYNKLDDVPLYNKMSLYREIAMRLHMRNQEDESLLYKLKAYAIALELKDEYFTAELQGLIGNSYLYLGDYEKARPYLKKGLSNMKDKRRHADFQAFLVRFHTEANELDSAKIYVDAIEPNLEIYEPNLGALSRAIKILSIYYEKAGDKAKALEYANDHAAIEADIHRGDENIRIGEIKLQEKLQSIAADHQEETTKHKGAIGGISIVSLLIITILFWKYRRWKKKGLTWDKYVQGVQDLSEGQGINVFNVIPLSIQFFRRLDALNLEKVENREQIETEAEAEFIDNLKNMRQNNLLPKEESEQLD